MNYFESEHVNSISDIKNNIIRGVLNFLKFKDPIYISTIADVPTNSGLGSSSAFAVGLLNAVHLLQGERISLPQLAEEACHIEIKQLKNPIGKQDQYATACGNQNKIIFNTNDQVNIENVGLAAKEIQNLFEHLLFFSTNIYRSADSVLLQQLHNTQTTSNFTHLRKIKENCQRVVDSFRREFDALKFGDILDESWAIKKQLSDNISNHDIDLWYEKAKTAGALGGKICGAGGEGILCSSFLRKNKTQFG